MIIVINFFQNKSPLQNYFLKHFSLDQYTLFQRQFINICFMKNLKIDLENKGVKFILERKVTGFQKNGSRIINVSTDKEILASDSS